MFLSEMGRKIDVLTLKNMIILPVIFIRSNTWSGAD